MTRQFIKIFGERNSGTRAITKMISELPHVAVGLKEIRMDPALKQIEQRVKDRQNDIWLRLYMDAIKDQFRSKLGGVGAWKHAAPVFDTSFAASDAAVLFVVKNPYSWLISLAKRPHHMRGRHCQSLEQFVDNPWMTLQRDGTDAILASPMGLWNEKLRAYGVFQENCDIPNDCLKFESFVENPVDAVGISLSKMGISGEGLQEIAVSTKQSDVSVHNRRDFYLDEAWKTLLSRQTVALINEYTDWEVAGSFGYHMLEPRDFPIDLPLETKQQITYFMRTDKPKANYMAQ